jgi:ABC-type sugar transport system substrate-binding protein
MYSEVVLVFSPFRTKIYRDCVMISCFLRLAKVAIFLLFSLSIVIENVYAEKMKVAFINPTHLNDPFWSMVTNFMESAATDLDIELQVYYSQRNRFKTLEIAQEILESPNKPDYLVFHFQAQMGARILQAAEDVRVYSFVINNNIPVSDRQDIGKPRDKFKYWLGHMQPEDQRAGYLLASTLVEKAIELKKIADDGKVHMIGLTGTSDNTASGDRNKGAQEFVSQRSDVILHQIVNASWDKEKAANATQVLMERYPKTSVVWSASDVMSLGAIEALKELELHAGKDVLVGGIDGSLQGMEAVSLGAMAATVSGHFIEGAWAMVLLYDHNYGVDFVDELGTDIHSKMEVIRAENITPYLDLLKPDYIDQIDFKSYSKVANSKLKRYQLTLPDED